ncbi:MAG TPA: hypothetical protein PLV53_02445 [Anaerolineaceae bacterium]|nr:hypothetical protein [Anaerolineaceae bacterium]
MGLNLIPRIHNGLKRRWVHRQSDRQTERLAREIERHAPAPEGSPVVIYNASTRLEGMSLNAAFALMTGWALRLQGVPVIHFVCKAGLTRCMLGTNRDDPSQPPPCKLCVAKSKHIYTRADVRWYEFKLDPDLEARLQGLSLDELVAFEYGGLPLGRLTLPSLRWALRLYHLPDTPGTVFLYRQYILSAWRVAQEFSSLLVQANPLAVVVFNGIAYPEAVAAHIARSRAIPVITHEVGLQPFSAFFTYGEATAYPLDIPADFELDAARNQRLDAYLSKRFKGDFTMAGIKFWPEMKQLPQALLDKAANFQQIVPVFTNVIFDTSQEHANVLFEHMFAWLDQVAEIMRAHPETLFVLRAHPDESRPGKASRETVAAWAERSGVLQLPNVEFVPSTEPLSSYELIQRSKFVMVYNSTIGLEASILGAAVLSGGRSRYTQLPTVCLPSSAEEHRRQAEEWLQAQTVWIPEEYQRNARKFLYYQLFRSSLPFNDVLEEDGVWRGFVRPKDVSWQAFLPQNSPTFRTILDGILKQKEFILPE